MRSFRDNLPEQCHNILETISAMQSILKRPVTSGSSRRSGSAVGMKSEVDPDLDRADQIAARAEDDFVLNSDKGRAPNFTTAELTALLDLINNDYHFAHGHWDKAVDAETVPGAAQLLFRERWKDITHQINAIGGYDREWREVKRKLTTWMSKVPTIGVFMSLCVALSLSVIVITDLDLGQIPQPPRNTESDLVHVRVTSGRLGGRFFYRVSETSLPTGDALSVLPLGYFYHHAPYSLLPPRAAGPLSSELPPTEKPN